MSAPANRYRRYADFLAFLHFLWTLVVVGGLFVMLVYPWYAILQMIAMSGTLLFALPAGNVCPLTLAEERLRKKLDPEYRNDGSFIATYLNRILKTNIDPHIVNTKLAGLYVIAYSAAIAILIIRL